MTEVKLPAPVKATLVDDVLAGDVPPGAYCFDQRPIDDSYWGYICFTCPHGCGAYHRLPIGLKSKPPKVEGRATWQWDGNRETPTLTPSIHHIDHWHGFLTKGFFTQA